MILGMTKNRNPAEFCKAFKGIIKSGVAVNVESEPSSFGASSLAASASKSGIAFTEADSLHEGITQIKKANKGKKARIIVTGSLFLISDFMKL